VPTTPEWFTHTAADHAAIECCSWIGSAPRAVVLIAHGAAEHVARYDPLAQLLVAEGYAVYAPDQRAHGRTGDQHGALGVARPGGWQAMISDLIELADDIATRHPGVPMVLFGHSMGSMLARHVMQQAGDRFAAFALSGMTESATADPGMVELLEGIEAAEGADAPSALFSSMFSGFNDEFAIGNSDATGYEWLSRDEAEVQRYVDDPWCGMDLSNGFVTDMLVGSAELAAPGAVAAIPSERPILLFAGDMDPVGGHGAALPALADVYRDNGLGPVTQILYPGGRHEMLNETNRDDVEQDLLTWLNASV